LKRRRSQPCTRTAGERLPVCVCGWAGRAESQEAVLHRHVLRPGRVVGAEGNWAFYYCGEESGELLWAGYTSAHQG